MEHVLQRCLDHNLAVNLEKLEFHKTEVNFLGHVIYGTEIQMQQRKVNAILDWQPPTKKKDVQAF